MPAGKIFSEGFCCCRGPCLPLNNRELIFLSILAFADSLLAGLIFTFCVMSAFNSV